jgi:8-oxo-dGTP pyrophosphatase MutT (NUDIX family)
MTVRPDLVDTWIFRRIGEQTEILLIHRSAGRPLPGLWQGVSGRVEPGERIAAAALREVAEETGFGPGVIEELFDLDLVNVFHWPASDGVVLSAIFAIRVGGGLDPVLSDEHDAWRWTPIDEAYREVIWPGYREAIARIRDDLAEPDRAAWFELTPDGSGRRIE